MHGRSDSRPAIAIRNQDSIRIIATDSDQQLCSAAINDCSQSRILPGIPTELILPDGDRFIPDNAGINWLPEGRFIAFMETHIAAVLVAAALIPVIFWGIFFHAIPAAATISAPLIPQNALKQVSKSSLRSLDLILKPSRLPQYEQAAIISNWEKARIKAGLSPKYALKFRRGFDPNAFALPDGTIVVFDELVAELSSDELLAVLFHEAGHVDLHHGSQMLIQAGASTFIYAFLIGDMEGFTETLIGTGMSLGENAFSRDMEREADEFARTQLQSVGLPDTTFANALRKIIHTDDSDTGKTINNWLEYFSSHPAPESRINATSSQ